MKKSISERLLEAMNDGYQRIGELVFWQDEVASFLLCHRDDYKAVKEGQQETLSGFREAREARELSTHAVDGTYRFTKGELNLKSGWFFSLMTVDELCQALNYFYPASVGLWFAQTDKDLRVLNLRDKLNRQTGMYRNAKNVSDAGCQSLVQSLCGPANNCVKKILWQVDEEVPLNKSEASEFPGLLEDAHFVGGKAIPMVCQEACNFFVANAAKKSKAEWMASQSEGE